MLKKLGKNALSISTLVLSILIAPASGCIPQDEPRAITLRPGKNKGGRGPEGAERPFLTPD